MNTFNLLTGGDSWPDNGQGQGGAAATNDEKYFQFIVRMEGRSRRHQAVPRVKSEFCGTGESCLLYSESFTEVNTEWKLYLKTEVVTWDGSCHCSRTRDSRQPCCITRLSNLRSRILEFCWERLLAARLGRRCGGPHWHIKLCRPFHSIIPSHCYWLKDSPNYKSLIWKITGIFCHLFCFHYQTKMPDNSGLPVPSMTTSFVALRLILITYYDTGLWSHSNLFSDRVADDSNKSWAFHFSCVETIN